MSQEKTGLAALRIIVISMGIVLIGGCILLFVALYQKTQNGTSSAAEDSCVGAKLNIGSGKVKDMIKEEQYVTLLIEHSSGEQSVSVIDLCNGSLHSRITLSPHHTK